MYKIEKEGNSLAVQWLGLLASTAGAVGSISGQGARIPPKEKEKKKDHHKHVNRLPPNAKSLWFSRCAEEVKTPGEEVGRAKVHYNVEFTFDTDARVAITIYYQATEEFQNGIAR